MMQLTANGKTVVCGYYEGNFAKRSSAFDPKITEYSLATGRPTLVYRYPGSFNFGFADVLWMNADGSTIVGSRLDPGRSDRQPPVQEPVRPLHGGRLITKNGIKPMTFPLNSTPFIGMIAF